MTRDQIQETLCEIIEEWTAEPRESLSPETDLTNLLDSFDRLDIAMDAEDEFDIMIPDEDMKAVVTLGDLTDLVERLQRAR